ncbi:hypothetical protein G9A89_021300 [Geosiphon pyriformis]|nr:hypothetical protein G9A89_021300 [Geosiphon pyriformis]
MEPEKETILFNMHSNPIAEHFHKEATIEKIKKRYYWPSISNKYIAVVMNYLTKWPEAKAIQKANTESIAKFIHQDLICQHECPKELLLD